MCYLCQLCAIILYFLLSLFNALFFNLFLNYQHEDISTVFVDQLFAENPFEGHSTYQGVSDVRFRQMC